MGAETLDFRREADKRLDVLDDHVSELRERSVRVETRMDEFGKQMQSHEQNNRSRFTEVFGQIGQLQQAATRLEATDEQHTAILGAISGKLDKVLESHLVDRAIAKGRRTFIKSIPSHIKWLAAILGAPALLAAAWQAFKSSINGG